MQQKIVLADESLCSRHQIVEQEQGCCKKNCFRNFAKFLQNNLFHVSQNFPQISWNFVKFKQILSKFCVSQNLHNAVSQQPYVGVEEEEEGGGLGIYRLAHPPR